MSEKSIWDLYESMYKPIDREEVEEVENLYCFNKHEQNENDNEMIYESKNELISDLYHIMEENNNDNPIIGNQYKKTNKNKKKKKKKKINKLKNYNIRKGDWLCNDCNNLNFSFRFICNRCGTRRPNMPTIDIVNFSSIKFFEDK